MKNKTPPFKKNVDDAVCLKNTLFRRFFLGGGARVRIASHVVSDSPAPPPPPGYAPRDHVIWLNDKNVWCM